VGKEGAEQDLSLKNCTFVKTILMIIIVFYHSVVFWGEGWLASVPVLRPSQVLGKLSVWLNSIHIYAFALTSGYLYYAKKYERNQYKEFLPFIKKKAQRLLIPYYAVSFLWAIPIEQFFSTVNPKETVLRFLFSFGSAQLWFLWALFDVFFITWPLSDFFKQNTVIGIVIAFFFYFIAAIAERNWIPGLFSIWFAFRLFPFFLLGFAFRKYKNNDLFKIPVRFWVLIDLSLCGINRILSKVGFANDMINNGLLLLICVAGACMAFFVLQAIGQRVLWQKWDMFYNLSKRAMGIYLFHQQMIYFTVYYLNGTIHPYLHATINFVSAILISYAITGFFLRFRVPSYLLGEKAHYATLNKENGNPPQRETN